MKKLPDMETAFAALLAGNAVFFIGRLWTKGAEKSPAKGYPNMGVSGRRDRKGAPRFQGGFYRRGLKINSALVRKRDPGYKAEGGGEDAWRPVPRRWCRSCIWKDLVREELLEDLKNRLDEYEIDGILDSGMVETADRTDAWYSPFSPVPGQLKRPGQGGAGDPERAGIVVICDNSPYALILPSFFQRVHGEQRGTGITTSRWRPLSQSAQVFRPRPRRHFFPALYLAVIRFHTQILPTKSYSFFCGGERGRAFFQRGGAFCFWNWRLR